MMVLDSTTPRRNTMDERVRLNSMEALAEVISVNGTVAVVRVIESFNNSFTGTHGGMNPFPDLRAGQNVVMRFAPNSQNFIIQALED
jgi:hypothetical protein